jgi:ERCC4-related helicase
VYCEVVTGQTKREEQLDDFDEGKFRVVANVMVLTEGFDCPNLETVFVRDSAKLPTIQMAGRGFRTHPGKDHCNIVQSKMTRWTFTRTATPAMSLVQRRGNWYTLGSNERVNLSAHKMRRKLLELGDIEMPPYILNNRRKRKAFAHV